MTGRAIAIITGAAALAAVAVVLSEHSATSPGELSQSHFDLALSCRGCHTPFQGTQDGCVHCHAALPPINAHADLHLPCGSCHREHRGVDGALVTLASQDCTGCHEHPSITAVKRHRAKLIARPLEAEVHRLDYAHRLHFEEIEDKINEGELTGTSNDCMRCHLVSAAASEVPQRGEHALKWSGCVPCHDSWEEAGLEDVVAGVVELPFTRFIDAARLPRVRFLHSPGHLQSACMDCHLVMHRATAIRLPEGAAGGALPKSVAAAKQVRNCFGCHAHSPDAAMQAGLQTARGVRYGVNAEEKHLVACADCHEFHGVGAHGDFPQDAGDQPPPLRWDVVAQLGGLTITPWLLAFLTFGGVGYVALVRQFRAVPPEPPSTDPDVSPQRMAEMPVLSPSYETSVAGLFIVGELAGVPLINRAMKSGFDVIDFVANRLQTEGRSRGGDTLDVLIAGAGPAGLGAATKAMSAGLACIVCEKSTVATTIRNYPRAKVVQSAAIDIPEYGTFFQENDESKEGLVRRWEDIMARTGVVVSEHAEVVSIKRGGDGVFVTEIQGGKPYRSLFVVLAIGVRGTPRRLGLAGESPERVSYNLIDPQAHRRQHILVVGGGNAACETVLALAHPELLNHVTLSHRGAVLVGVTPQNSQGIDNAAREGRFQVISDSKLQEIRGRTVILADPSRTHEIENDLIFAMIGADPPTKFLRSLDLRLAKKRGF